MLAGEWIILIFSAYAFTNNKYIILNIISSHILEILEKMNTITP